VESVNPMSCGNTTRGDVVYLAMLGRVDIQFKVNFWEKFLVFLIIYISPTILQG